MGAMTSRHVGLPVADFAPK